MMTRSGVRRAGLAVLLALAAGAAWPAPAQAWWHGGGWRGGVFFGVLAPPILYPPPIYYPPPPAYYPAPVYPAPVYPAPAYAPAPAATFGQSCHAGAYLCPLDLPGPVGAACSCPANKGRVSGRIG